FEQPRIRLRPGGARRREERGKIALVLTGHARDRPSSVYVRHVFLTRLRGRAPRVGAGASPAGCAARATAGFPPPRPRVPSPTRPPPEGVPRYAAARWRAAGARARRGAPRRVPPPGRAVRVPSPPPVPGRAGLREPRAAPPDGGAAAGRWPGLPPHDRARSKAVPRPVASPPPCARAAASPPAQCPRPPPVRR